MMNKRSRACGGRFRYYVDPKGERKSYITHAVKRTEIMRVEPLLEFIEELENVRKVVKCPYCGYEGSFRLLRTWKYRFYDVEMLECATCEGRFNYYLGASPKGKRFEFVIGIRPRTSGGAR